MPELEKTEKITINLGLVDLGQIDLLVQEGFYTNRTDFVRTAIRKPNPALGSRARWHGSRTRSTHSRGPRLIGLLVSRAAVSSWAAALFFPFGDYSA